MVDTSTAGGRSRKHVVVLGGGFGGVQAAIALRKQGDFRVTLVSDRDFLYLFPISIWVPTRGIAPERARVPLAAVSRVHRFDVVTSTVTSIDAEENTVTTADTILAYDYLVIALGAEKVGHRGLEHTLSICGAPDAALAIRDRIDQLVAQGHGRVAVGFGGNPKDGSAVRGGPAFELMFNLHQLLRKKGLRESFELTFFAPMPHPGERMGDKAAPAVGEMFAGRGVGRRFGTKIAAFDEHGVAFADGSRLDADLTVFIPGGSGHRVLAASGLPLNDAGFVRIDDHCLVAGTDNVYAVGDVAALDGPQWRAKQGHLAEVMARVAVHNIVRSEVGDTRRRGYQQHLSIVCLMDMGSGAALIYRDAKRSFIIPLPVVGHWLKRGWGVYARATKLGRAPRLPGL